MASKNKTEKLALNLWAETDRPQRADFNSDNMIVEEVLGGHIDNADLHLTDREKSRVQSPLVSTSYIGDGKDSQTVTLPCQALGVMVYCDGLPMSLYDSEKACVKNFSAVSVFASGENAGLILAGSSLTVSQSAQVQDGYMTCLNENGRQYRVTILR